MSEMGPANFRSALGMLGERLALKAFRRKHMVPGAFLARPGCAEGYDPYNEDPLVPQLLCPVCSSPLLPLAQLLLAAEIDSGPCQLARC